MPSSVPSKYKSKIVHWDAKQGGVISKREADALREGKRNRLPPYIYRFDSTLEFCVYIKLLNLFPPNRIKRQVPVELIPKGQCHPKGKTWKVDFAITYPNKDSSMFYVEAKGRITPEFRNTLPILEHTNPEVFNKLILVFGSKIPHENRVIANLLSKKFISRIHTLKSFNLLKALK